MGRIPKILEKQQVVHVESQRTLRVSIQSEKLSLDKAYVSLRGVVKINSGSMQNAMIALGMAEVVQILEAIMGLAFGVCSTLIIHVNMSATSSPSEE